MVFLLVLSCHMSGYPLFCSFWIHMIFTPLLIHVCLCSDWNFIFWHFSLSTYIDLGTTVLSKQIVFNKKNILNLIQIEKIPVDEIKKELKGAGLSQEAVQELLQVLSVKSLTELEGSPFTVNWFWFFSSSITYLLKILYFVVKARKTNNSQLYLCAWDFGSKFMNLGI